MIKTDEQFRISKENGNMRIQQHEKTQEAGKESWRQKNKWKRWYLEKMRENTVFTQHWSRRSLTLTTACDYPVFVQSLTKQASHAVLSTAISPSAWPDRLPAMGCFCLSDCHLPEDRKSVQAWDWPASAQLAAHQCSTWKQQDRARYRQAALGWGWDRKTA